MPHESDWTKRFMELWAKACRANSERTCGSYIKENHARKRGIPDVWCRHAHVDCRARNTKYGPDARIEFKRGNKWPTKQQLVRMVGLAQAGCPTYLIQLLDTDSCHIWFTGQELHACLVAEPHFVLINTWDKSNGGWRAAADYLQKLMLEG